MPATWEPPHLHTGTEQLDEWPADSGRQVPHGCRGRGRGYRGVRGRNWNLRVAMDKGGGCQRDLSVSYSQAATHSSIPTHACTHALTPGAAGRGGLEAGVRRQQRAPSTKTLAPVTVLPQLLGGWLSLRPEQKKPMMNLDLHC